MHSSTIIIYGSVCWQPLLAYAVNSITDVMNIHPEIVLTRRDVKTVQSKREAAFQHLQDHVRSWIPFWMSAAPLKHVNSLIDYSEEESKKAKMYYLEQTFFSLDIISTWQSETRYYCCADTRREFRAGIYSSSWHCHWATTQICLSLLWQSHERLSPVALAVARVSMPSFNQTYSE